MQIRTKLTFCPILKPIDYSSKSRLLPHFYKSFFFLAIFTFSKNDSLSCASLPTEEVKEKEVTNYLFQTARYERGRPKGERNSTRKRLLLSGARKGRRKREKRKTRRGGKSQLLFIPGPTTASIPLIHRFVKGPFSCYVYASFERCERKTSMFKVIYRLPRRKKASNHIHYSLYDLFERGKSTHNHN